MPPFDDFIHVPPSTISSHPESVTSAFFANTTAPRLYTEGVLVAAVRAAHPSLPLTIISAFSSDLLAYGATRPNINITPHGSAADALRERTFQVPARRYGGAADEKGRFVENVVFGCFEYVVSGTRFLLYVAEGADGMYGKTKVNYLVGPVDSDGVDREGGESVADGVIREAAVWGQELHEEVLVFDQGYWQKSKDLWRNMRNAEWEDVILENGKKDALIGDVVGFFDSEERYAEFNVPWKRGIIFYGPPGNGKTISTKALMHQVSKRVSPSVEILYVKTFNSFGGPEYGIRQIFLKARQMSPCLLIFEDIDSLVNVTVRSYFLNEVDGLESNHGILMIGSTNHLERLDPGIAKRPSRFDRKYFFDVPTRDERIQYSEYWRNKLKNNKKIDFPKEMSTRVADITGDFSFAYMKEAFVAALLVIVANGDERMTLTYRGDPLSDNLLWKELKRQVENLRKEMNDEEVKRHTSDEEVRKETSDEGGSNSTSKLSIGMKPSGMWPSLNDMSGDEIRSQQMRFGARNTMVPRYM